MWVRFKESSLKGSKTAYKAPSSFLVETTIEVLSLSVWLDWLFPITINLVVLEELSSILLSKISRLYLKIRAIIAFYFKHNGY